MQNHFKALLCLIVFGSGLAPAEAYVRTKSQNCLKNVCTRIILDWQGQGEDVCFAHNANRKSMLATVDIYPFKYMMDAVTTHPFPATLAGSEEKRIFAWTTKQTDWRKESCVVKNVQQRLILN